MHYCASGYIDSGGGCVCVGGLCDWRWGWVKMAFNN